MLATCSVGAAVPLAAQAQSGDACPNAELRQGPGSSLSDCRAYEEVSPPDKNGNDVFETRGPARVAPSGDAAIFRAYGAFAGAEEGGWADPDSIYYAHRTGGAWSTIPVLPRPTAISAARDVFATTTDLSASLIFPFGGAFEPDPTPATGSNYYLRRHVSRDTDLLFNIPENDGALLAGSSDLGHVAFTSTAVLTDDAPPSIQKVYEYTDGAVRLVSRQPGTNEPLAVDSALAGLGSAAYFNGLRDTQYSSAGVGAISADGRHIFVETPPAGIFEGGNDSAVIYRRSDGTTTELASPSRRTPVDPLGPKGKVLLRTTPDGGNVFFKSAELLTDDANTGPTRAGADLYRYDMASDELVDISATPGGDGARVQGVVGVSDDGDRVYYVALGEVAPGTVATGDPVAGQPNLYLWEDDGSTGGVTRFVATMVPPVSTTETGDGNNWTSGAARQSRVTRDGRYVLLQSQAALTDAPTGGTRQVYRYDADAAGGDGELLCASCDPGGAPSTTSSSIPGGAGFPRGISEDGEYVFFSSGDALVSRDANGRTDAYVWSGGEVDLLSTGKSTDVSRIQGASEDGRDAFFTTRERLVPADVDSSVDLYTARIGGGLLSQQAPSLADCAGGECQGPGTSPPPVITPGSSDFLGSGNVSSPRSCAKLAGKATRARKSARKLGLSARRASGERAKRLKARHRVAKKRYGVAQRKLRQCKRGAK